MPWKIEPAGDGGFFVVNAETGKKMSKKPLAKKRAEAQMRALYKFVPESKKEMNDGIMIALYPPKEVQQALAVPGGCPPEELHLTLAYLGSMPAVFDPYQMFGLLESFCGNHAPIAARTSGTTVFQNAGESAFVVLVDSPLMPEFRQSLVGMLRAAGIMPDASHGFIPHITLAYIQQDFTPQTLATPIVTDFVFDEIRFCVGNQHAIFKLNSANMVTKEVGAIPTAVTAHGGPGGLLSASGLGDSLPMNAAFAPGQEASAQRRLAGKKKKAKIILAKPEVLKQAGKNGAVGRIVEGVDGYRLIQDIGIQTKEIGSLTHTLARSSDPDALLEAAGELGVRISTKDWAKRHKELAELHHVIEDNMRTNGLFVYKESDGRYRWVAFSSNAYRDRDEEIVSIKALMDDVQRADKDGNYGPLRWWHVPGVDIGTCDFNMMNGRILIESGTFKNAAIARTVKEYADKLELSLGFTHPPDEPDASGVFHRIRRFERSLCPAGRVSNRFTRLIVQ